jgi:carotenoid cleavage dioxygenase-like enzyme
MIFSRILGFFYLINLFFTINSFVPLKPTFIKPTILIQNNPINKNTDILEKIADPPNKFPISGFYGLIGPKIDYKNVSSLFDLFTGDGIIQGMFLENGTATFTQGLINTEKRQFENTHHLQSHSKNVFITLIHMILNYLRIIPNMLGVANTAFLQVYDRSYALFERDMPYEIRIDSSNKQIDTIKRQNIPFLSTFSGHSKVINGNIETIEYNILNNQVIWYQLDSNFKKLNKIQVQMKYIPMVHDFYSDNQYILLIESVCREQACKPMTVTRDRDRFP